MKTRTKKTKPSEYRHKVTDRNNWLISQPRIAKLNHRNNYLTRYIGSFLLVKPFQQKATIVRRHTLHSHTMGTWMDSITHSARTNSSSSVALSLSSLKRKPIIKFKNVSFLVRCTCTKANVLFHQFYSIIFLPIKTKSSKVFASLHFHVSRVTICSLFSR